MPCRARGNRHGIWVPALSPDKRGTHRLQVGKRNGRTGDLQTLYLIRDAEKPTGDGKPHGAPVPPRRRGSNAVTDHVVQQYILRWQPTDAGARATRRETFIGLLRLHPCYDKRPNGNRRIRDSAWVG